MTKLFAVTVMSICLIMSVGFYGIAGADDTMDDTLKKMQADEKEEIAGAEDMKEKGDEMINVTRTVDQDAEAAAEEGEKVLDDAEMKEEGEKVLDDAEQVEMKEEAAEKRLEE